jgi:serine/threonine-protein kinase 11
VGSTFFQPLQISDSRVKPKPHLNQYRLGSRIKSGSTSTVYHAVDNTNHQFAAKSTPLDNENTHASVAREIESLNALQHPNIVKLHEVIRRPERHSIYLFMDLAKGSLQNRIFAESDLATVYYQVADALAYIHSQGFAHLDIKPSNILLFDDNHVKICDFGNCTPIGSADYVLGSPGYQAPELLDEGTPDLDLTKEDVWSFGIALYESAFGKLPFGGETVYEVIAQIQAKPVIIPETASPELKDLLEKVLVLNPSERISMEEVLAHPFFGSGVEIVGRSRSGLCLFDREELELGARPSSWPQRTVVSV